MVLDNELQEAILRLKTVFERAGNQTLIDKTGYGASHYRLLKTIAHLDNPTQRAVANELGQTQAAVSRQIKLLIDGNLVVTEVNPKNRRENLLSPTPQGRRIARKAHKIVHEQMQSLLGGLDEQTIRDAVKIFNEIADQIQKNND